MAIDAYLKTAAAQLRRAALTLKQDSGDVRKYITNKEQDTHKTVQQLEQQIQAKQSEANQTHDSSQRARLEHDIQNLHQQIQQTQRETEQEKQDRLSQVQTMESKVEELVVKATDLERQPGSF